MESQCPWLPVKPSSGWVVSVGTGESPFHLPKSCFCSAALSALTVHTHFHAQFYFKEKA